MQARNSFTLTVIQHYYWLIILFIGIAYLLFAYFFIPYSALAADEFVFARHIFEYTYHLPYRDFPPYKTVLGYYLLSLPMFFSHSLLLPFFYIKGEIAIINMICIGVSAIWARRFFNAPVILLVLFSILSNLLFLIYSVDLRVDMLTAWLCLFAIFLLLENRVFTAGVMIGIAFLISQKAIWYLFAIDGAMLICWLSVVKSDYRTKSIFLFNVAALSPLFFYIVFWSLLSSPSVVFYNLFYEAYVQAGIDVYVPIYWRCWQAVLSRGPALFLLWPITFLSLFASFPNRKAEQQNVIISHLSLITLLLFIYYKQPFPYNFVFLIPAFFVLYAQFGSWLVSRDVVSFSQQKKTLAYGFFIYTICLVTCIWLLSLTAIYYTLTLIPIALFYLITAKQPSIFWKNFSISCLILAFTITAILSPLNHSFRISSLVKGDYQQTMLTIAANILQEEDGYVGGIPFLYQKDQSIGGMKNLIEPSLQYLFTPTENLKTLLLPSLYLDASSPDDILNAFNKNDVKLIINNPRIQNLPDNILVYIATHYQHYYGSIYIYAPRIEKGKQSIALKFTAQYRVESALDINIDDKMIHSEDIIFLEKGDHVSRAKTAYRLVLVPKTTEHLNPDYEFDSWYQMIRGIVV